VGDSSANFSSQVAVSAKITRRSSLRDISIRFKEGLAQARLNTVTGVTTVNRKIELQLSDYNDLHNKVHLKSIQAYQVIARDRINCGIASGKMHFKLLYS
jgi:hypothetical protein